MLVQPPALVFDRLHLFLTIHTRFRLSALVFWAPGWRSSWLFFMHGIVALDLALIDAHPHSH